MARVNDFRWYSRFCGCWRVADNEESDADPRLGAQRGRGAARWICNGRQSFRDYDVSAIDAAVKYLGGTLTKGDAPDRGNNSARTRRSLPHGGQRAGSAGSMPVEAPAGNANLGSEVSGAQRFGFPSKERKKRRCRRCLGSEVSGAQRFGFPSKERKKRRCRRCLGTGSGQTPQICPSKGKVGMVWFTGKVRILCALF
jgi:hypothetical protein